MLNIGLEHMPLKPETTLYYGAGNEWSEVAVGADRTTTTTGNTSSASSIVSRATANLENEIESCGNVFILNRRKLFLICGFCESKYANIVEFSKHISQGHKILDAKVHDASSHGGSNSVPWETTTDSDHESTTGAAGLIVKGGFLIRFVSEGGGSETDPTPPPQPSLDENLLKHVPIKLEDESDDDMPATTEETLSKFEDNIESCGNVFVINRKKLFLHCGFCEGKYGQMEQLAAHLHECHTIFQDDNDCGSESGDVSPQEDAMEDVTIKQEPEEVSILPKKCIINNNENAPPMVAIPIDLTVDGGDVSPEKISEILPVVAFPAASRPKTALKESRNTMTEKKSPPAARHPGKGHQKKPPKDKKRPPSPKPLAKKAIKDYLSEEKKTNANTGSEYACKDCDRTFVKQYRLIEHIRVHTGEKPYKCDECGKTFRIKLRMTEHQLRHRTEKAFICELCGLGLATRQDYTLHQRHHRGDKRYACKECGKAFVRSSDLKTHERIHSGERPFKCEVCNIWFRANQNLIIHRRVHQGDKQFKCDYCDKRFFRKIDKRVHHRTHTGEKAFKCEICGRGYSAKVHVRRHLQKRHMAPFQTQKSSEDDSLKSNGKKKKKRDSKLEKKPSKSFKCDQCPKAYSAKVTLRKHKKQAHDSPVSDEQNSTSEQQTSPTEEQQTSPIEEHQTSPTEEQQTSSTEEQQTSPIEEQSQPQPEPQTTTLDTQESSLSGKISPPSTSPARQLEAAVKFGQSADSATQPMST